MTRTQLWKRWRRWTLVLGFFALGIPTSAASMVRSSASRERLQELASNAIRDELGLDATIGSVQLRLVPFSLVARNIALDDPVYGRTAEADELVITPSFRTLLRGGLDIQAITIRRANLRLVVRNGQVRNLPRADTSGDGGPPRLPFDSLEVHESTLTVDAEPYASGQLRNVELHLYGTDDGIGVRAQTRRGWIRHAGGRETLRVIDGIIEVTESEVRAPHLRVHTPELQVLLREARAPLPFAEHGYQGEVELAYDLAHLARAPFPEDVTIPPIVGRVEANLEVFTDGDDQRARGQIDLRDVRIEQFGIGEHTHLELEASQREVRILEGSIAHLPDHGGAAHVEGTISLDPERGFPVDVEARLDELSMARLMLDLGVTQNGIVEWFFNGNMGLRGQLDPLGLEGPVRLATHGFQVSHDPYHADRVRRVISVSRGDFTGRWSIRPDAVRFHNLVGELPRSRIRGNVLLGFDNQLRVSARAEVVDLADIAPLDQFPIAGTGTARCDIDGTFQDPHVTGHVAVTNFVFDTFRLGDVESDALLDPDGMGVHFAMVHGVKRESRYRVEDLYLDFHRDRFELTGLLHLDPMRIEDFYHVFGFEEDERFTPYQGVARGQATLHYTNGFPTDSPSGTLDVDMNLDLPEITLDDYTFTDGRMVGRWRWLDWSRGARGAELQIAHLSLRKGTGTVTLDGQMSLGGALRMNAIADRLAIADLEGVGDQLPGVEGVATAIGTIGGTFDVMRAVFDIGVTNVTYDGRPLGDGRFYARLTDREDPFVVEARDWNPDELPDDPCARARFGLAHSDWPADPPVQTVDGPEPRLVRPMAYLVCGRGLDERLIVDLALGRTRTLPLRGALSLDRLDLTPMLPATPDGARTTGLLTGMVAFTEGAVRDPETLGGTVRFTEARVAQGDLEIRNQRDVRLVFKDGVLAIDTARFVGPGSTLSVRGYASLDEGLALGVDGDLDLGLVARGSRFVEEASGRVRGHFNVTGEIANPELYGRAVVDDGAFRFTSMRSEVEHLNGAIRFSERSVLFDEFEADVAGGRLTVSGAAELRERGIEQYAFDVGATGLQYDFDDGVDAGFGGQGRLVWRQGDRIPTLTGVLRVDRFNYARPIENRSLGDVAASFVRGAFRSERTAVRRYDPEQDMVALDVRVMQQAPFRIQNNLINASVRIATGDQPFRIVGTDQRFGVHGVLDIPRGQVFFQGYQFDVRTGTIEFHDDQRVEPHLDIEAVTEIRRTSDLSAPSYRITLTLTGTPPRNLSLRTRSEPELSQQDVLTLLAIGMTRAELNQLQQGEGLATSAALDAITRVTGVDRAVRRTIGLDDFGVINAHNPRTGRSEPRVSVSSQITDRVRATAQTGVGESREFRGGVEVTIDENQRVGVSYDNYNYDGTSSFGNLGIDWVYHLEFE